jgi:hypothetical protein
LPCTFAKRFAHPPSESLATKVDPSPNVANTSHEHDRLLPDHT